MKRIIYGLYAAFLALTAATFFVAGARYDGLVEDRYYEKAAHFFDHGHGKASGPECSLSSGPCVSELDGRRIVFDINPKPVRAMEELTFSVSMSGDPLKRDPSEVSIDLKMPGMFMGTNKVLLKKAPNGNYRGTGVIPRCPRGGTQWLAMVSIPEMEGASFSFDVAR